MRHRLLKLLRRLQAALTPKTDPVPALRDEIQALRAIISEQIAPVAHESQRRFTSMLQDLAEAVQMAGSGPWKASSATVAASTKVLREACRDLGIDLRETADGAIGAYGDINLMLANANWRREIQLGWLEFSRWGIQQIILVCRLYYVKNPIVRRLVDVCAAYVFARGVEVTTNDPAANEVLRECWERNKSVLGQIALVECEKRKDYDGNLFWCFFPEKADKGVVDIRLIDASEVQEIITNPEDRDDEWYFLRQWTQQVFMPDTGVRNEDRQAWYPRVYFDPSDKPDKIRGIEVMWDSPVYHRKCGYVGQWLFGCPRIFPMVDWAREARLLLEACASIKQSLMQFAMIITAKGGQQAMSGVKQQMGTTVGPNTNLWDRNPPTVAGGTFVSGPGTELKAFDSSKGGGNPDDVRQYKLMCCMVKGCSETFLADVSTGNLATATSLDRPYETTILAEQEEWVEDLAFIARYVLEISAGATSGVLRESAHGVKFEIREAKRTRDARGRIVYESPAEAKAGSVEIQVNFPAIREGDVPALVNATVAATTFGNKSGEPVGIDITAARVNLYNLLGIDGGEELAEEQKKADEEAQSELAANPPMPQPPQPTEEQQQQEAFRRRFAVPRAR